MNVAYQIDGHGAFTGDCLPGHPSVSTKLNDVLEHESDPQWKVGVTRQHLHSIKILTHESLKSKNNV